MSYLGKPKKRPNPNGTETRQRVRARRKLIFISKPLVWAGSLAQPFLAVTTFPGRVMVRSTNEDGAPSYTSKCGRGSFQEGIV